MVELASAAGWLQGILLCSEELSSCSFPLYFLIIQTQRKTVNLKKKKGMHVSKLKSIYAKQLV